MAEIDNTQNSEITQQPVTTQKPEEPPFVPIGISLLNGATEKDLVNSKVEPKLEKPEVFKEQFMKMYPGAKEEDADKAYQGVVKFTDNYKSGENYLNAIYRKQGADTYYTDKYGKKPLSSPKPQDGMYYDVAFGPVQVNTPDEVAMSQGVWKDLHGQKRYGLPNSSLFNGTINVTEWDDETGGYITAQKSLATMQPGDAVQSLWGNPRTMDGSNVFYSALKGLVGGALEKSVIGITGLAASIDDMANVLVHGSFDYDNQGSVLNKLNNNVTNFFSGVLPKNQDETKRFYEDWNSFFLQFADGVGQIYSTIMFSKAAFKARMGMNSTWAAKTLSTDKAADFAMYMGMVFGSAQSGGMMRNIGIQSGINPNIMSAAFFPYAGITYLSESMFMANTAIRRGIGWDKFVKSWDDAAKQIVGTAQGQVARSTEKAVAGNMVQKYFRMMDEGLKKMGKNKYGQLIAIGLEEGTEELAEGFGHYPIDHILNFFAASQGEKTLETYGDSKFVVEDNEFGRKTYFRVSPMGNKEEMGYNVWSAAKKDVDNAIRWKNGETPLQPEFWNWDEAFMAAISAPFGSGLSMIGSKEQVTKESEQRKYSAQRYAQQILNDTKGDPAKIEQALDNIRAEMEEVYKKDKNAFGAGTVVNGKEIQKENIQLVVDEIRLNIDLAQKYGIKDIEALSYDSHGMTLIQEVYDLAKTSATLSALKAKIEAKETISPEEYIEGVYDKSMTTEKGLENINNQIEAISKEIDSYLLPEGPNKKTSKQYSQRLADYSLALESVLKTETENMLKRRFAESNAKKIKWDKASEEEKNKYWAREKEYIKKEMDAGAVEAMKKTLAADNSLRTTLYRHAVRAKINGIMGTYYNKSYMSPTKAWIANSKLITEAMKESISKYNTAIQEKVAAAQANSLRPNQDSKGAMEEVFESYTSIFDEIDRMIKDEGLNEENVTGSKVMSSFESEGKQVEPFESQFQQLFSRLSNLYYFDESVRGDIEAKTQEFRKRYDAMNKQLGGYMNPLGQEFKAKENELSLETLPQSDPKLQQAIRDEAIKIKAIRGYEFLKANFAIEDWVNQTYEDIKANKQPDMEAGALLERMNLIRDILQIYGKSYFDMYEAVLTDTKLGEEHNPMRYVEGYDRMTLEEVAKGKQYIEETVQKLDEIENSEFIKKFDKTLVDTKAKINTILINNWQLNYIFEKIELGNISGPVTLALDEVNKVLDKIKHTAVAYFTNNNETFESRREFTADDYAMVGKFLFDTFRNEQSRAVAESMMIDMQKALLSLKDTIIKECSKVSGTNPLMKVIEAIKVEMETHHISYAQLSEFVLNRAINLTNSAQYEDNGYLMNVKELYKAKPKIGTETSNIHERVGFLYDMTFQLYRLSEYNKKAAKDNTKQFTYSDLQRMVVNDVESKFKEGKNVEPLNYEQINGILHGLIFFLNPNPIKISGKSLNVFDQVENNNPIFGISGLGGSGKTTIISHVYSIYKSLINAKNKLKILIVTPSTELHNTYGTIQTVFANELDFEFTTYDNYKKDSKYSDYENVIFDEASAMPKEFFYNKEGGNTVFNAAAKNSEQKRYVVIGDTNQVHYEDRANAIISLLSQEHIMPFSLVHRNGNRFILALQGFAQKIVDGQPMKLNAAGTIMLPEGEYEGNIVNGEKEGVFKVRTTKEVEDAFMANVDSENSYLVFDTYDAREAFLSKLSDADKLKVSNKVKVLKYQDGKADTAMVSGLKQPNIYIGFNLFDVKIEDKGGILSKIVNEVALKYGRFAYTALSRAAMPGMIMVPWDVADKGDGWNFIERNVDESNSIIITLEDKKKMVPAIIAEQNKILGVQTVQAQEQKQSPTTTNNEYALRRTELLNKDAIADAVKQVNEKLSVDGQVVTFDFDNPTKYNPNTTVSNIKDPKDTGNFKDNDRLYYELFSGYEQFSNEFGENYHRPELRHGNLVGHPFMMRVVGQFKKDGKVIPIVDIYTRLYTGMRVTNPMAVVENNEKLVKYMLLANANGFMVNKATTIDIGQKDNGAHYLEETNDLTEEEILAITPKILAQDEWKDINIKSVERASIAQLFEGVTRKEIFGDYINTKESYVDNENNVVYLEPGTSYLYYRYDDKEGKPILYVYDEVSNLDMRMDDFNNQYKSIYSIPFFESAARLYSTHGYETIGLHVTRAIADGKGDIFDLTNPANVYIRRKQEIMGLVMGIKEKMPVIVEYINNIDNYDAKDKKFTGKQIKHGLRISIDMNRLGELETKNYIALTELLKLNEDLINAGVTEEDLRILGYDRKVETDYGNSYEEGAVPLTDELIDQFIKDNKVTVDTEDWFKSGSLSDRSKEENRIYNLAKLQKLVDIANSPNKSKQGYIYKQLDSATGTNNSNGITEGRVVGGGDKIVLSESNAKQQVSERLAKSGYKMTIDGLENIQFDKSSHDYYIVVEHITIPGLQSKILLKPSKAEKNYVTQLKEDFKEIRKKAEDEKRELTYAEIAASPLYQFLAFNKFKIEPLANYYKSSFANAYNKMYSNKVSTKISKTNFRVHGGSTAIVADRVESIADLFLEHINNKRGPNVEIFENVYETNQKIDYKHFTTDFSHINQPNYIVSKDTFSESDANNEEPDLYKLVDEAEEMTDTRQEVLEQIELVLGKSNMKYVQAFDNLIKTFGNDKRIMGMLEDYRLSLFGEKGKFYKNVGRHEAMHFLIKHLLTPAERDAVLRSAKNEMPRDYNGGVHEYISDVFETYKPKGGKKTIFRQFIDALKRFFNWVGVYQYGFREFLERAEYGEYADRNVTAFKDDFVSYKVISNRFTHPSVTKMINERLPGDAFQIAKDEIQIWINNFSPFSRNVKYTANKLPDAIKLAYAKIQQQAIDKNQIIIDGEPLFVQEKDVDGKVQNKLISFNKVNAHINANPNDKSLGRYRQYYAWAALGDFNVFMGIAQTMFPKTDLEKVLITNRVDNGVAEHFFEDNEQKNAYGNVNDFTRLAISTIPRLTVYNRAENRYQISSNVPYHVVDKIFKTAMANIVSNMHEKKNKSIFELTFTDLLDEIYNMSISSQNGKEMREIAMSIHKNFIGKYKGINDNPDINRLGRREIQALLSLPINDPNRNIIKTEYEENIKKRIPAWRDLEFSILTTYKAGIERSFVKADLNRLKISRHGALPISRIKGILKDNIDTSIFDNTGQIKDDMKNIMNAYTVKIVAPNAIPIITYTNKDSVHEMSSASAMDIRQMLRNFMADKWVDAIDIPDTVAKQYYYEVAVGMIVTTKFNIISMETIGKLKGEERAKAMKNVASYMVEQGSDEAKKLYRAIHNWHNKSITDQNKMGYPIRIKDFMVQPETKKTFSDDTQMSELKMPTAADFVGAIELMAHTIYNNREISDTEVMMVKGNVYMTRTTTTPLDQTMSQMLSNKEYLEQKKSAIGLALSLGIDTPIAENGKIVNSIVRDANGQQKIFIEDASTIISVENNDRENESKRATAKDVLTAILEAGAFNTMRNNDQGKISVLMNPFSDKSRTELVDVIFGKTSVPSSIDSKLIDKSKVQWDVFIPIVNDIVTYQSNLSRIALNQFMDVMGIYGYNENTPITDIVPTEEALKAVRKLPKNSHYILSTTVDNNGVKSIKILPGNHITLNNSLFSLDFVERWQKNLPLRRFMLQELIKEQTGQLVTYMKDIGYKPSEALSKYYKEYYDGIQSYDNIQLNENHPLLQAVTAATILFNESYNQLERGPVTEFKNIVDYVKRAAKDIAPAIPVTIGENGMNPTFNAVFIDDIEIAKDKYFGEYYEDMVTNGFVSASIVFFRQMQRSVGGQFGLIDWGAIKPVYTNHDFITATSTYLKCGMKSSTEEDLFYKKSRYWRELQRFLLGDEAWNKFLELYENRGDKDYNEVIDELIDYIKKNNIKVLDVLVPPSAAKTQVRNLNEWKLKDPTKGKTFDNIEFPDRVDGMEVNLPTHGLGIQSLTQKSNEEKNKPLPTQLVRLIKNFKHNADLAAAIERILSNNVENAVSKFIELSKDEQGFKEWLIKQANKNQDRDNIKRKDLVAQDSNYDINVSTDKHIENIIKYFNEAFKLSMIGYDGVQIPSLTYYYFDNETGNMFAAGELGLEDDSKTIDGFTRRLLKSREYVDNKYVPEEVVLDFQYKATFGIDATEKLHNTMTLGDINLYQSIQSILKNGSEYRSIIKQQIKKFVDDNKLNIEALLGAVKSVGIRETLAKKINGIDNILTVIDIFADFYYTYNKALDVMVVRIPTTGAESAGLGRIVGFASDNQNAIETSPEKSTLDGSDYDNDPIQIFSRTIDDKINLFTDDTTKTGIANTLFNIFEGYYNDIRNKDSVIKKTESEQFKALIEKESIEDAVSFPKTMAGLADLMKTKTITKAGRDLVGHFANMMVFFSEYFGMNLQAQNKGIKNTTLRVYDVNGDYVENGAEYIATVMKIAGELVNLATDNVNESGALGRMNINENNTSFIAGFLLSQDRKNNKDIREKMIKLLKNELILRAFKIVDDSKSISDKGYTIKTWEALDKAFTDIAAETALDTPFTGQIIVDPQINSELSKIFNKVLENRMKYIEENKDKQVKEEYTKYLKSIIASPDIIGVMYETINGLKEVGTINSYYDFINRIVKNGTKTSYDETTKEEIPRKTSDQLAAELGFGFSQDRTNHIYAFRKFFRTQEAGKMSRDELSKMKDIAYLGEQFKRLGEFAKMMGGITNELSTLQEKANMVSKIMGFATIADAVKWLNADTFVEHDTDRQLEEYKKKHIKTKNANTIGVEKSIRKDLNIAHIVFYNPLYKSYVNALAMMFESIESKFDNVGTYAIRDIIRNNTSHPQYADEFEKENIAISQYYNGELLQELGKTVAVLPGTLLPNSKEVNGRYYVDASLGLQVRVDIDNVEGYHEFIAQFPAYILKQQEKLSDDSKFMRALNVTLTRDGYHIIEMINSKYKKGTEAAFLRASFAKLPSELRTLLTMYHLAVYGKSTRNGSYFEFINPGELEMLQTNMQKHFRARIKEKLNPENKELYNNYVIELLAYNQNLNIPKLTEKSTKPYSLIETKNGKTLGIANYAENKHTFYYTTMPYFFNPHGMRMEINASNTISNQKYYYIDENIRLKFKTQNEITLPIFRNKLFIMPKASNKIESQGKYYYYGEVVNTSVGPVTLESVDGKTEVTDPDEIKLVKVKANTALNKPLSNKKTSNSIVTAFIQMVQKVLPNVQFMADNTIQGFGELVDGVFKYNPDLISLETPIHELAHIFTLILKNTNTDLYEKIMMEAENMMNNNHPIYQHIIMQKEYQNYGREQLLHEIIAHTAGLNGINKVEDFIKANNILGDTNMPNRIWAGIKNFVRRLGRIFTGILNGFGINLTGQDSIRNMADDMLAAVLNQQVITLDDSVIIRELMMAAGYNKVMHIEDKAIITDLTVLNNALRSADNLKTIEVFDEGLEISNIRKELEATGDKFVRGDMTIDFSKIKKEEWDKTIKEQILSRRKTSRSDDLTLKVANAMNAGGNVEHFGKAFGIPSDSKENFSSDVIMTMDKLFGTSRVSRKFYVYSELKNVTDPFLRSLYDEKLEGFNPLIAVTTVGKKGKEKHYVSIAQITNQDFYDVIKKSKILSAYETSYNQGVKGISLLNVFRDMAHVNLTLLANKLSTIPNVIVDDVNLVQLHRQNIKISYNDRNYYTEQLQNMLKVKSFADKLSPEMKALFSSVKYRDSVSDYSELLTSVYTKDGANSDSSIVLFDSTNRPVVKFDELQLEEKIDVLKRRLKNIYAKQHITDKEYQEAIFVSKTIDVLTESNLPGERMNTMRDLGTFNVMSASQFNVPHEALAKVVEVNNNSGMRVSNKIIQFNKDGFDKVVEYFSKDRSKIELVDKTSQSFDKIRVYETLKDKNGNEHRIWTGHIPFSTDKNIDPVGYKLAQELERTDPEALKYSQWMVQKITEYYAKLYAHKYYKKYEDALAIIEDGITTGYKKGMMPFINKQITEKLGEGKLGQAINQQTGYVANAVMAYDELYSMDDSGEGIGFLDKMPDEFSSQMTKSSSDERSRFNIYGQEAILSRWLGLGFDAKGDIIVSNIEKQEQVAKDFETVMKIFVLAIERKIEYENNVLPIVNGIRAQLTRMNDLYKNDAFYNEKQALKWLDAWQKVVLFGKGEKIKSEKTNKIISSSTSLVSAGVMLWNTNVGMLSLIHNGMTAFAEGISGSITKAIQGDKDGVYFTAGNLVKASADVINPAKYGIITQLGFDNQLFNGTDYELATHQVHQKGKRQILGEHSANWFNWSADYYARGVVLAAMMREWGMQDAVSLNKDGEVVYDEKKDKRYWNSDGTRTEEQIARKIFAQQELKKDGYMQEIGKDIPLLRPFYFKEIRNIRTIASNYITGAYSQNEANLMSAWVFMRFWKTFKSFFMTKWNNAVQRKSFSKDLGYLKFEKDAEGNVMAKWERAEMEGYFRTVGEMFQSLFSKDREVFTKEWWFSNPTRIRNISRFLTTLATFLSSYLIYALLAQRDDEDDDGMIAAMRQSLGIEGGVIPENRFIKNFLYSYESLLVIPTLKRMVTGESAFASFSIMGRMIDGIMEADWKKFSSTLPLRSSIISTRDMANTFSMAINDEEIFETE